MKIIKILLMSTYLLIGAGAIAAHSINYMRAHDPTIDIVAVDAFAVEATLSTSTMQLSVTAFGGDEPLWNQVAEVREGSVLFERTAFGDPYLERSQAWIRNNNLLANARLHTFMIRFSHARSIA